VTQTGDEHGHHEEAHEPAPGPTIWPFIFALGVALILVGVVLNWVVFGIGVGIAILAGMAWAREATAGLRRPTDAPDFVAEETPRVADDEEPQRYDRGAFLSKATLGIGALIGGVVTVPVVGFAVAPTFIGQGDEDIDLGPIANFPEGQWRVAQFESQPEIGDVSARAAFVRYNGLANELPSFTILSNRCVHVGCPTQPAGITQEDQAETVELEGRPPVRLIPTEPSNFTCPCHGGSYDLEGNRVAGPPVRALDRYSYKIVDGNLVLGERYSVGKVVGTGTEAVIESYTRFDPGQHVDGPTNWLYPASPQGI
jgi:Rieske Fe-S protein